MNLSPSIDLIWRQAAVEMAAGDFREIQPEHFCMALLKFSETTFKTPQQADEQAELAKVLADEAISLREALQQCGIESTSARRKLRSQVGKGGAVCKGGTAHRSAASRLLFDAAAKMAEQSGTDKITALHLLTALFQSPTPAIGRVVLGKIPSPARPVALPLLEKDRQEFGSPVVKGQCRAISGVEAQSKVVLQTLQQKDRKSVLLISDSDDLMVDLAAYLVSAFSAKDVPEGLEEKRLVDVSANKRANFLNGMRPSPDEKTEDLGRLRQLLAEAESHPDVILLVPSVEPQPNVDRGGPWHSLLREALANGSVQLICRVSPQVFNEHLRKDPIWKRQTHAVWLERAIQGSVPREL